MAADLPPGTRVLHLDSVDSTNAEAMRRALAGEPGPLWIVARRQTAGKGRSGRSWESQDGNLMASLLVGVSPAVVPRLYQASLVAGVAVARAIRASGGLDDPSLLQLKWPNDLLIGGRKLGGILVESTQGPGGARLIIGIGLNIEHHPSGPGMLATSLAMHGTPPGSDKVLCRLANEVAAALGHWQEEGGFEAIRAAWLDFAGPLGSPCSVNAGQQRAEGRFAGLDEDGALLIVDSNGQRQRFTFGDVTLAPDPPA